MARKRGHKGEANSSENSENQNQPPNKIPKGGHKYFVPKNPSFDDHGRLIQHKQHHSRASSRTSQRSTELQHIQDPTATTAKPIFVDSNIQVVKNVLANIRSNLKSPPSIKILSGKQVKIVCCYPEDKAKIIEKLSSQQISSFTFSEQKPTIYILKDYEHIPCEQLKKLLVELELPVIKVTYLIDKPYQIDEKTNKAQRPIYMIHFEPQKVNLRALQSTFKAIDHTIIKWERFDRSKKRLTQCHNCQQHGHSASNCKRQYRCVKCTNNHLPGQCSRKSAADEGTPNCVNCQGAHTANSRICPLFISYAEKVKKNRINRQQVDNYAVSNQRTQSSAQWALPNVPRLNDRNFPKITPQSRIHVSSTQNGSSPDPFAQLDSLKTRLNAIPGIDQTIKIFGNFVSQLESAQDERERQSILFKFLAA